MDQVLVPNLTRARRCAWITSASIGEAACARLEAARCQFVYLTAYSPDFNPIELAFSKLKACLRRAEARTQNALDAALSAGLAVINPADAHRWIRHCGYALPRQPL